MRNLLSFLLLVLISSNVFGQRPEKIDSLKTLLAQTENGIDKFELLNHLWKASINSNIEESDQYANEMIALGAALELDSILYFGYERKAVGFAYRNVLDSSGYYFRKVLAYYLDEGDLIGAGGLYRNIGQDLNIMGDLDSAYYYYDLAGAQFAQANDSSGMASIYNSKAVVYWQRGYYNLCIDAAIEADWILQRINEPVELHQNYMVIATAYSEMKDTVNALKYYDLINTYFRAEGLQRQLGSTLIHSTSLQIPNTDLKAKVERNIEEALEIAEELQSVQVMRSAKNLKANLVFSNGKYAEAKSILLNLVTDSRLDGFPDPGIYSDLGKTLIALGEYRQAESYLRQGLALSQETGMMTNAPLINKYLSTALEKQGKNTEALLVYKEYKTLNDSIYNSESQNRFKELQTIYETEKKEAQLALQAREIETLNVRAENDALSKTLYGIGMFSFFAIALLLYFGFTQRIKKNKIAREKQEEIYKQEIAFKKKELTSQTLHLVQKSTFIQELKENLEKIKQSPDLFKVEFRRLVMLLKKESAEEKEWEVFKSYFSEVHNDFDQSLKAIYSDITEKEIRLASFIRMNLNTKEIASILHVLPDSVLKSKYRLKKKLKLDKDQDLNAYLNGL